MIESMELQQIVAAERDRIARDLHDGVIQKVYTAGLLVDSFEVAANRFTIVLEPTLAQVRAISGLSWRVAVSSPIAITAKSIPAVPYRSDAELRSALAAVDTIVLRGRVEGVSVIRE